MALGLRLAQREVLPEAKTFFVGESQELVQAVGFHVRGAQEIRHLELVAGEVRSSLNSGSFKDFSFDEKDNRTYLGYSGYLAKVAPSSERASDNHCGCIGRRSAGSSFI